MPVSCLSISFLVHLALRYPKTAFVTVAVGFALF